MWSQPSDSGIGMDFYQAMLYDDPFQETDHFDQTNPYLETGTQSSDLTQICYSTEFLRFWATDYFTVGGSSESLQVDLFARTELGTRFSNSETGPIENNQKKRGRHKKEDTELLEHFKTATSKTPRKENLRMQMIRSFKRAIREVTDSFQQWSQKLGCESQNSAAQELWTEFRQLVIDFSQIQEIGPTTFGPEIDGRAYGKKGGDVKDKTWSDSCCKRLFASVQVRKAFRKYLDVVFLEFDVEALERWFEFSAVSTDREETEHVWKRLKNYFYNGMFFELKLESPTQED